MPKKKIKYHRFQVHYDTANNRVIVFWSDQNTSGTFVLDAEHLEAISQQYDILKIVRGEKAQEGTE